MKSIEFDMKKSKKGGDYIRKQGDVVKENALTVWVRVGKDIIKRHKVKHMVEVTE